MTQRITDRDLIGMVDRLNRITKSPSTPYARVDGRSAAQIGNFHLSHAYGGVCLHRMVDDGGGASDVLSIGHVPKRDLYNALHAFIRGMDFAESEAASAREVQS
jgi:hypothetical protein